MIRDITIGQYYPVESVIHRLDPRTKLAISFLYIISLFLANNKYMYLLALAALVVYIGCSKVPLKFMLKGLKGIAIFILFSVVLNMFFTKGDPFLDFAFIHISWQGFRTACYTTVRIIFLVLGAAVITYTTTPTKLTDGLERAFSWLKRFRVTVHEIAMMVSIALRFIPTLMEETDKIMKAQAARGADFESGSLINRAKAMIPILVPLFISAFRRADELATAMECRCYGVSENRTSLHCLKFEKRDLLGALSVVVLTAAVILTNIYC